MMLENFETYTSHLSELKTRIIKSLLAILITSSICFAFAKEIFQFLVKPLNQAATHKGLIYTGLADMFLIYIKIAIMGGVALALPVILWQIYRFLAPGLYLNEKKILLPYLISSLVLFLVGFAIAYFFVMPLAWQFFISFEIPTSNEYSSITFEPRVNEYLSIVINLIMAFGLAFQLPLLITILVLFGIIKANYLVKKRRIAIVLIFCLSAIITPPDAITQIALAIPLVLLYELSIIVSRKLELSRTTTI